jgi:hypothetical protein
LINSKDPNPEGQLRCTDPHTVDSTDIKFGYDALAPQKLAEQDAAHIWRVGRADEALPAIYVVEKYLLTFLNIESFASDGREPVLWNRNYLLRFRFRF